MGEGVGVGVEVVVGGTVFVGTVMGTYPVVGRL